MVILQDTREQNSWDLTKYGFEQEVVTLKTGDYTVRGFEDILVCERKASTSELSINFGSKWKAFSNELKRMKSIENRYIICEFPLQYIYSFPASSSIPRQNWANLKITSAFLAKRIEEICSEFDINVVFSENRLDAERKFIEVINAIID